MLGVCRKKREYTEFHDHRQSVAHVVVYKSTHMLTMVLFLGVFVCAFRQFSERQQQHHHYHELRVKFRQISWNIFFLRSLQLLGRCAYIKNHLLLNYMELHLIHYAHTHTFIRIIRLGVSFFFLLMSARKYFCCFLFSSALSSQLDILLSIILLLLVFGIRFIVAVVVCLYICFHSDVRRSF